MRYASPEKVEALKRLFPNYMEIDPYNHAQMELLRRTLLDEGVYKIKQRDTIEQQIINLVLQAQGRLKSQKVKGAR